MVTLIILSLKRINFWGIFFPIGVILIVYADQINVPGLRPWPVFLSAFFLSLGLSLVFNKGSHYIHFGSSADYSTAYVNEQDGGLVNCSTVFGDCIKYINTDNFKEANIRAVFGDVKLYFDNAHIESGRADIFLDVVFGDVELFIPRDWKIINESSTVFGDFTIRNNNIISESPIVYIKGNIIFGDVKVIYV